MTAAQPHLKLKADMVLKGLSLTETALKAGVPYTRACAILSGKIIAPDQLERIRKVIRDAKPTPEPASR